MKIEDERGFLILACNNDKTNYVKCAEVLAKSIKLHTPNEKVCLLTDTPINSSVFDYIKVLPYGDQSTKDWKLDNDWQVFEASPFRETIKIEADMIVTSDLSHWWDIFRKKDVVICTNVRDYKGEVSEIKHYRKIFELNNIPNTYNAITYWKLSKTAQRFFQLVKHIFSNWNEYKKLLVGAEDEEATTDLVYGIASVVMGIENVSLPTDSISFVHMKPKINNLTSNDWRKQLVWELTNSEFRINTVTQQYPVHYHIKEFADDLNQIYDELFQST